MAYTKITTDGLHTLNNDMNTSETTIYVGELNGATVAIGHTDPDGNWNPFPNATLTSHIPLSLSHGHDVMLVALVSGVSGEINIETKKEGLGGIEGLLSVIADNTSNPTPNLGGESIKYVEIGNYYTTAEQLISGRGAANSIIAHYGGGGLTTGEEFTVGADGIIRCHKNHIEYLFNATVRFRRINNGGEALLLARLMYAPDGVNFLQVGSTFGIEIDDSKTTWRENLEVRFSPIIGSALYMEVARDPAGTDSGDIGAFQPSGDTSGWNPIPSASLTISKAVVASEEA